jgi:prepilin-type N-terminal cleavage/methylation domain-containing protein/prepilin-type processing-associated H-X9-DG protein
VTRYSSAGSKGRISADWKSALRLIRNLRLGLGRSICKLGCFKLRQGTPVPTSGFTLVELLVVIAVIAILAGLLLPTLSRAKAKGQGIACLNNIRQLMLAWKMYPEDNNAKLVRNAAYNGIARYRADTGGWIHGWLDFSGVNTDNTNILKLIGTADGETALFGKYVTTPLVYKCPADPSTVRIAGHVHPRVRSFSMNQAIGSGSTATWLPPSTYIVFQKESDIVNPAPVNLLTLLDEHPDSINDAGWAFPMHDPDQRAQAKLIDIPASYHNGAGSLSFADGHSEIHKWLDPRTQPPIRFTNSVPHVASPNNPDADWLAARVSSRKDGTKSWW